MRTTIKRMKWIMIAGVIGLISVIGNQAPAKPLKVFILAGQSNMQGHVNQAYHHLGAAKIIAPIGKAFAEAMVKLQKTNRP